MESMKLDIAGTCLNPLQFTLTISSYVLPLKAREKIHTQQKERVKVQNISDHS